MSERSDHAVVMLLVIAVLDVDSPLKPAFSGLDRAVMDDLLKALQTR